MTTLPQTTHPVRLPRPGAVMPTVPGSGLAVGMPGLVPSMTGADVWRVIRANFWLILGLLAISAVAGYGINSFLARKYPQFTATGYIQVQPQRLANSSNDMPPDQLAIELKSQAVALRTELLLSNVISNTNSQIRTTELFKSFNNNILDFKEYFFNNYSVEPIPDSRVIRIQFTSAVPKDCKTIVDEVVDMHLETQKKLGYDALRDLTVEYNNKRMTLEKQIHENEDQLVNWRTKLNVDGGGLGRVGLLDIQLQTMGNQLFGLQHTYAHVQEQYAALSATIQSGATPPIVDQYVNANPIVAGLQSQVQGYDIYLMQMRQKLGANNQSIKNEELIRDALQKKLDDEKAELTIQYRTQVVAEMQLQVQEAGKEVQDMTEQVNQVKQNEGELSNDMNSFLILDNQTRGLREELKTVQDRLDENNVKAIQNMQTKVQWMVKPEIPTNMSFPQLKYTMPVAIAIGLALGLGIAFLREMTDTTVRSPRDIARVGQMNLLGMVADESDDPQAAGARLPLVIFDAPHSMTAEQLRQVRTRLQHAASLDTTRSIMVTSPSPGDGKTTIACNLAAGLALNGRRILLVDSNFRRPEIHRIFAVGNEQGFSDVLNGSIAFDEVVQETQVPNLSIMTSGPRPINATEMFESQLLIDFIERALEEFDHVIFDSGPLMVVSESVAMAPRVDGVVSVVRARGNSRGLLGRMRDDLRKVKAEHLGVVLNAVRAQGGGYYRRNIQTYYDYNG